MFLRFATGRLCSAVLFTKLHNRPPGYALPSQSWHHRSLWIWCSSDLQQVGSESAVCLQLHDRYPDLSSRFQSCAVHVILPAFSQYSSDLQQVGAAEFPQSHNRYLDFSSSFESCAVHVKLSFFLQLTPHCQNCYGVRHTVNTAAQPVRLSKVVHCMSCCQHCCTSHAFNTGTTHNTLSTSAQHIAVCQHWHSTKASVGVVAAHIGLPTLMELTHTADTAQLNVIQSTVLDNIASSHHTPATLTQRIALDQPLAQTAGCSCGGPGQGWSSCPPTLSPAIGASAATPTFPRASTCM